MLMKSKNNILSLYRLDSRNDQTNHLLVNKTKIIIGSSPNADITIESDLISHYHCMIVKKESQFIIIDLHSKNGTIINGEKIESYPIEPSDQVQLGNVFFEVSENENSNIKLIDQDKNVKNHIPQKNESNVLEKHIEPIHGLEIIDDEYCDIIFNEQKITLDYNPLEKEDLNLSNYVDTFEFNSDLYEPHENDESDIVSSVKNKKEDLEYSFKIEISIFISGVLIDYRLIDHKESEYFLSSNKTNKNTILCEELGLHKDVNIFKTQKNGTLKSKNQDKVNIRQISDREIHFEGEHNILVIVKGTNSPSKINLAPLLTIDKNTKKEAIKVFSLFFIFFLSMILIPTTEHVEKEEEPLSIVFKPTPTETPQEPQEQASSEVSEEAKDQGVREEQIDESQPQMAQETQPEASQEVTEKVTQAQSEPKNQQINQRPKSEPQQSPEQEAPQEKFQINSESRMKRLAARRESASKAQVQESSSVSRSAATSSTSQQRSMDSPAREIQGLARDRVGEHSSSSGARGLASRQGHASTYVEPKTVVLGSMDPELLRKILREYLPQFRHCYQQELDRKNDELAGVLDLNFRILSDGNIDRVKIEVGQSDFSGQGTSCMGNVLRMIEFPQPKGGGVVDVRQPLNFSSERRQI